MNNKFIQTIAGTADGIKRKRAENTATAVKLAQESLLNQIRSEVQAVDAELTKKLDIGPDSADSLRPVARDFNAAAWVQDVQTLKVSLKKANERLDVAQATYNEWFADLPEATTAAAR